MVAVLRQAALLTTFRKDYVEDEDAGNAKTSVLTLKINDYGLWQLVWDFGTNQADYMLEALASGEDLGRWGIVFRNPYTEQIVASGPITTVIASDGRRNGIAADAVSCWGVTDLTHFRERITFPDPTTDIPVTTGAVGHTWSAFTRTKTGPRETIALDFIRENIGSTAIARRRLPVPLNVPTSLGRGGTDSYTVTANENVLTVVQQMGARGDLVFDVLQVDGAAELDVVVREPQVREGIVWSTDLGTANGVSIKAQRRPKTDVINSGSGDDPTTVYVRRVATAPTGGFSEVREEFIKGSGADPEELSGEADEELIEDGPETGVDVEPAPEAPWQVGVDYEIGDRVIGMFADTPFTVPLLQVVLRHEDGTLTEEPSAGFEDDDSIEPVLNLIFRELRKLRRRL